MTRPPHSSNLKAGIRTGLKIANPPPPPLPDRGWGGQERCEFYLGNVLQYVASEGCVRVVEVECALFTKRTKKVITLHTQHSGSRKCNILQSVPVAIHLKDHNLQQLSPDLHCSKLLFT